MDNGELSKIIKRPGYGVASAFNKGSFKAQASGSREMRDVESGRGYESLRAEAVAINYTGKCIIRIKFYRRRLADYSRANCEKYIIDSLTYAGVIRDDSETEIQLIDEGQEKVATPEEERVEITLEYSEVDFDNLWVKREKLGNIGK